LKTPDYRKFLSHPISAHRHIHPVPDTPIDLNALGDFTGHDPVQTLRLARHFAETTRKTLVEILAARDSGDLGALNRLGHKQKSSSAMAGARECANLCLHLEKAPDLPTALDLVGRLEPAINAVSAYVQTLGDKPAGG
jgi:HPt (histidine-containing phosphotransfer) domain-containing protein